MITCSCVHLDLQCINRVQGRTFFCIKCPHCVHCIYRTVYTIQCIHSIYWLQTSLPSPNNTRAELTPYLLDRPTPNHVTRLFRILKISRNTKQIIRKPADTSRCRKHIRNPWTFCSDKMFVVQVLFRGCQNIQISFCMQEKDQGRAKLGRRSCIYIYIYMCNISIYNQGSRARAQRKPRFTHAGPMPFWTICTAWDMQIEASFLWEMPQEIERACRCHPTVRLH